ncbi:MAG TPA: orotidine-5'-phosphate decarboxylase [Gemmataceae bacterium]|nr:orotidine-5'-phosphate decarboxylase [Gemmataceae bacterium]
MDHFADGLTAAIRAKGNAVCVGLDPRWESLPVELRSRHGDGTLTAVADAFEEFCCRIIDVVAPLVAVVKPQVAFFEACGPAGMRALQRVLQRARQRGLITILDGKRNDIASTAAAYADAAFGGIQVGERRHGGWDADAVTVNPYLGRDSVEPFLESARRLGRGVFVLVRTSNPGAGQFQDLVCDGRPLYLHVADAVGAWSKENLGKSGFGDVGAVVGATQPAELAAIRQVLPHCFFLVPGFGAQGAGAAETAPVFRDDGLGAIVNSSRAIIFAFASTAGRWETAVESATRETIRLLAAATSMGSLTVSK